MKLTWFAGTTIRIHIGGAILVADPDAAPAGVDRGEIVSGADRVLHLAGADAELPITEPASWRPRQVPRAIEEAATPPVLVHRIGPAAVLVDAAGEPPLVLIANAVPPRMGRWAGEAVVVLFGPADALVASATALLEITSPRLLALATPEAEVDRAVTALSPRLEGTGLVALEPGLALEL